MENSIKIAFICIGNTSRSQMAESWARSLTDNDIGIYSAGTRPGKGIKDVTAAAMASVGCSLDGQYPKALTALPKDLDYVVIMGEGVECPDLQEKHRLDWGFPDLDGSNLDALAALRDQIGDKVRELLHSF